MPSPGRSEAQGGCGENGLLLGTTGIGSPLEELEKVYLRKRRGLLAKDDRDAAERLDLAYELARRRLAEELDRSAESYRRRQEM